MKSDHIEKKPENQLSFRLIRRFPFVPVLQRASVLVKRMDSDNLCDSNFAEEFIIFTKGAPEIISTLSNPHSGIPKL